MTNVESLRLDALKQVAALVDETGRFSNQQFAERRIMQCHIIIKCIDEQEKTIHRMQDEYKTLMDNYTDMQERMKRMVLVCESYGINYMTILNDPYLTAAKLAKIRTAFPKEKLDNISDKAFDWLLTDDVLEEYDQNPGSFDPARLEELTKQLEQKYGKA